MPFWLIQALVIVIAIYRFKIAQKYMRSKSLFLKEIRAPWIDESRIDSARKLHFALEMFLLIFTITFPMVSKITVVKPFLIYIFSIFSVFLGCFKFMVDFPLFRKKKSS